MALIKKKKNTDNKYALTMELSTGKVSLLVRLLKADNSALSLEMADELNRAWMDQPESDRYYAKDSL
jgi:hypothetical protein